MSRPSVPVIIPEDFHAMSFATKLIESYRGKRSTDPKLTLSRHMDKNGMHTYRASAIMLPVEPPGDSPEYLVDPAQGATKAEALTKLVELILEYEGHEQDDGVGSGEGEHEDEKAAESMETDELSARESGGERGSSQDHADDEDDEEDDIR